MAQLVRISAGYSEKSSENYNSTSYSINLEMDAQINCTTAEVEQASNRLFQLCRKIVDHQKGVSVDSLLNNQAPPQVQFDPPQQFSRNVNNGHQCSEKQVRCIFGAAKARGMTNAAIPALAQRFGKNRIEELTATEASSLIGELKR